MESTSTTKDLHALAVDAALWATPIVSFDAMRQAFFRDAGAYYGDVVYLSRFADWRLQLTTPNASTRYVYLNINTGEGPVVLEIPPAIGAGLFGSILDAWQVPLADVGPQGLDEGKGGRYLLLPPGRKSGATEYIAVPSITFNNYVALRAIADDASDEAVARALALVRQIQVYPLAKAYNPTPTRAIDMAGRIFDGIMRFDDSFYVSLARMVNEELALPRDSAMLANLKLLGIEKGKAFEPGPAERGRLQQAGKAALALLMEREPEDGVTFWPGTHWRSPSPIGAKTRFTFETEKGLDVDARAQLYFAACAPPRILGRATMYLTSSFDADGRPLTVSTSYRLRVPPNPPASQFWAVTVYDSETCGFIRDSPKIEVNSYHEGLETNPDGSIDLLLSARAPDGNRANWIALSPGRLWFPILRFYGPTGALFDKSWRASDIERLA